MKMNITFCVSSIPNHRIVNGISAATGRFRPKSASGAPVASSTRHEPAAIPSGTPIDNRETEAQQHPLQRCGDALHQRALVQQAGEAGEHFARAGQHDRRHQPRLNGAERDEPPRQEQERQPARTEQISHGPGGETRSENSCGPSPTDITSPSGLLPDRP